MLALVSVTLPAGVRAASSPGSAPVAGTMPSSPIPSSPSAAPLGTMVDVAPAYSPPTGVAAVGPVSPESRIEVAVGLALPDPSALRGLLTALYAPGTPEFRHYLTTSQLAQRFGPSAASIAAATAYFERFGLSVNVSPDHLLLVVGGGSGRVGNAFGTMFEEYRGLDGSTFFSHPTAATLPPIAPWSGAYGLGDSSPIVPSGGQVVPVEGEITPSAGCAGVTSVLLPCQVWQAYDTTALISGGTNGSNVRVAVVDPYSSLEGQSQLASDLATFATGNGIPAGSVNFVYPVPPPGNLNSSSNTGWTLEDALDLEWARASAPGATIDMTLSPNAGLGLYEAVDWLVAHQAADVISMSWGEPDVGLYNAYSTPCSSGCNASTDGSYGILSPVLAFAAAEGISLFAASGDCGAADGTSGVATNYPASDPDVTGVGGTVLNVDASGDYLSEAGWSGNDTGARAPGCSNQGGSGGGYSPFPRPEWQRGPPPSEMTRGVPDVALDAGTPVSVVLQGNGAAVDGTSVATPVWAGIAAIGDQFLGRPLGLLNPGLYAIASGSNYSRDFHDVVSGSNGYPAGPGWDPVTGLGSPIVGSLLSDLGHTTAVSSSNLAAFLYASPRFGRAPLTVGFHVNATGGTGTYPLEGVSFGEGNASFAPGGATTYTYTMPGVYMVQSYVADSASNVSLSPPVAVVVGGGTALSVNLSASTETPARGTPVIFTTVVKGGVGPYRYNYSFGDGTFTYNSTLSSTTHAYGANGGSCAAVVVSDSASPVDGGASARLALAVGGASRPDCGNDTVPLVVDPVASLNVRDAPADYPQLFTSSGGSTAAGTLAPSVQYSTTDPYLAACDCAIFRAPGTFHVTGFVNDSENEQSNASVNVTVAPPLVGAFTASPTYGSAPLTVDFQASVTGGAGATSSSTVWSFGDGTGAVGATATATYSTPGFYLAVGQVSDLGDGNTSRAFLIDVQPSGATSLPLPPFLTATVAPAVDVPRGATVNFTARLVSANGTDVPAVFHWGVGSGFGAYRAALNWTLPVNSTASGNLAVSLSATLLATAATVNVTLRFPSFVASGSGPTPPAVDALDFLVEGGPSVQSMTAPWNASATVTGPGTLAVNWAFGDGTEEQNLSVHHAFPGGLYTVVATASDSWGDVATSDLAVAVSAPLALTATLSTLTGAPPLTVAFRANVTGGIGPPFLFRWTFGDGGASASADANHTFAVSGSYRVFLNVSDLFGRSASANWTVNVAREANGFPVAVLLGAGAAVGVVAALLVVLRRRTTRGVPATP